MLLLSEKVAALTLFLAAVAVTSVASVDEGASTYPSGIPVNVGVVSSWENTPISLEALEFLCKTEGDSAYKSFIKTYRLDESATAQAQYASLVAQLSEVLPEPMVPVLELGLASRTHSPAVAVHTQLLPSTLPHSGAAPFAVVDRRLIVKTPEELVPETVMGVDTEDPEIVPGIIEKVDHVIVKASEPHEVYVYGVPGTEEFAKFHEAALALGGKEGGITYVVRYFWDKNGNGITGALAGEQSTPLQGYGVEFSLKSVEYKTIDERRADSNENTDPKDDSNKKSADTDVADSDSTIEKSDEFDSMDAEKIRSLGMRAGTHIINAKNPLAALRELTEDFPVYAVNLDRDGNKGTVEAMHNLRMNSENAEAENRFLINGKAIKTPDDNIFSITSIIADEMKKALKLRKLGIEDYESILSLLSTRLPSSDTVPTKYNISSPEHIVFLNDLEKDPEYEHFPSSVRAFLQPVWHGQLHYVAKNLFNIVLVVDPSDVYSAMLISVFSRFVKQNLPMRVGILFYAPQLHNPNACNEVGECNTQNEVNIPRLITKMFHYVKETKKSSVAAASFFTMLIDAMETEHGAIDAKEKVDLSVVKRAFKNGRRVKLFGKMTWDGILALGNDDETARFTEIIDSTNRYIESMQLTKTPLVFVNGALVEEVKQPNHIIGYSNYIYAKELAERIRAEEITDDGGDTYAQVLATPYTVQRFSRYAVPTGGDKKKYVSLVDLPTTTARYFHSINKGSLKQLSVVACTDFGSESGKTLLTTLANNLHGEARLAVFPKPDVSEHVPVLWKALYALAYVSDSEMVLNEAVNMIDAMPTASIDDLIAAMEDAEVADKVKKFLDEHDDAFFREVVEEQNGFCAAVSGDKSSVIVNGRVVEIDDAVPFEEVDFDILQNSELPAATVFLDDISRLSLVDDSIEARNDVLMKVISQVAQENVKRPTERITLDKRMVPSFTAGKEPSAALAQIDFVADPLSRTAQHYAPILERLAEALPVHIRVYLTPREEYDKLPLKTFYRYVLEPKVTFDAATGALLPASAHRAIARGLPATRLITLGMEVPHKWIVMASAAVHDLDNIRLGEAEKAGDTSVDATFRLEHILVEGNCYDAATMEPPRGLELELTPRAAPTALVSDTLVMSNFGYFQLKAVPGLWNLHLRGGGRSALLYSIEEASIIGENNNNNNDSRDGIMVVVNSMDGATVRVVAKKNPGYEKESLLDIDDDDNDGKSVGADDDNPLGPFWDNLLKEEKTKVAKEDDNNANVTDDDTINVFSIASGHLYERFIKIMMLSVLRGTKSPVKFWFIKNYLSPQFKETIDDLSKHYGFDYELITYKWPHWLHPQTEKQRITWGYKILFLDVTFPVSLKKVIYVDADQVVRSDLRELMEIPLDGAPIAMTPFCRGDSKRNETAGYRFWDQGFWKEHLRGKPYHISALFVVDLQRFRQIGAGDTYRAYYDNLAGDPNSLSNLDQDLPNYLQDKVPMKSLPQEWLWCQTWCNDESKARAKTIDLCNNPMTKIPKLDSARINIPEWNDLDNDIHNTEMEILKNKSNNNNN